MIDLAKEDPIHVSEACKLFGVHRRTVEGWFNRGLEKVKVGGRIYTSREAVLRYLEATNKPKVPKVRQPQIPRQPKENDRLAFFRDLGCY